MKFSRLVKSIFFIMLLIGGGISSVLLAKDSLKNNTSGNEYTNNDTISNNQQLILSTVEIVSKNDPERYTRLTDEDFEIVAKELGIEVAAIKAVVEIEAGKSMKGFWAPGVPVINFDNSMYAIYKNKAESKAGDKNAKVPEGLSGKALKEWTLLTNMRKINLQGADMGTFWGMFQIGGFHYKKCGCASVEEFVNRMSYSEFEQLQLFAIFIKASGMVESLKNKNWSAFARRYNGPSYAKRGYHTKMANAYAKFKKEG